MPFTPTLVTSDILRDVQYTNRLVYTGESTLFNGSQFTRNVYITYTGSHDSDISSPGVPGYVRRQNVVNGASGAFVNLPCVIGGKILADLPALPGAGASVANVKWMLKGNLAVTVARTQTNMQVNAVIEGAGAASFSNPVFDDGTTATRGSMPGDAFNGAVIVPPGATVTTDFRLVTKARSDGTADPATRSGGNVIYGLANAPANTGLALFIPANFASYDVEYYGHDSGIRPIATWGADLGPEHATTLPSGGGKTLKQYVGEHLGENDVNFYAFLGVQVRLQTQNILPGSYPTWLSNSCDITATAKWTNLRLYLYIEWDESSSPPPDEDDEADRIATLRDKDGLLHYVVGTGGATGGLTDYVYRYKITEPFFSSAISSGNCLSPSIHQEGARLWVTWAVTDDGPSSGWTRKYAVSYDWGRNWAVTSIPGSGAVAMSTCWHRNRLIVLVYKGTPGSGGQWYAQVGVLGSSGSFTWSGDVSLGLTSPDKKGHVRARTDGVIEFAYLHTDGSRKMVSCYAIDNAAAGSWA